MLLSSKVGSIRRSSAAGTCPGFPPGDTPFLDAVGTCLILVKRDPPINPVLDDHGGVHHSFAVANEEYKAALDHLRAHGVEIL